MPWRPSPLVLLLALVPVLLQPLAAMAADPAAPAAALPTAYRLETLALRVQRAPGHGQPPQQLAVAGTGAATLEAGRGPERRSFTLQPDEVMALLDGLYRLRFFDLPAVLRARPSVFLLPDGSVGTQVANKVDAGTSTVCVSLPGYEKCVRYTDGEAPAELEAWVRAAFADVLRRAPSEVPKK